MEISALTCRDLLYSGRNAHPWLEGVEDGSTGITLQCSYSSSVGKSQFRLLSALTPISLMLCYQMSLPEARLPDAVLTRNASTFIGTDWGKPDFYGTELPVWSGLLAQDQLGHFTHWWMQWWVPIFRVVIWAPFSLTWVLTSMHPQIGLGNTLERKVCFKYIFLPRIPCQLFLTFLLCILLVHIFCSHGLSSNWKWRHLIQGCWSCLN